MKEYNHRSDEDIEIEVNAQDLLKEGTVDEKLYSEELKQRKLTLNDDINIYTVGDIVRHIIRYNTEDKGKEVSERKPIILYLSSAGGSVDAGFELIDIIMNSKTPVYTVNLGYQYSMGFLIGLAGHKRFAAPNAKFLLHDGSNFIYNSGAKAQDEMAFQRRVEDKIRTYVLFRSKLSEAEYDSKLRVEWYMFSEEAKEKGFTDYILGTDCDIDEIV